MKHLKMFGGAAVAVVALMALLGGGTGVKHSDRSSNAPAPA
ncbi:MAG TPA: hypothetical protein VFJ65_04690 [Solirubrobacterales bacterium]|nr:hypothetical protein [Solirubrobacterales bacterium]